MSLVLLAECIFWLPPKNHQLALLAVSLNFQYLCLLTLIPSINPNPISFRAPMKFGIFDLVCFSQRRLLVEIQLFSSPGSLSFVEFNCCVAWMSSLLVTVSSDFRVKPKRNKLMVAHQAAIFVLVRGKYVRGLGTNLPWMLAREEKHGGKRNTECIGVRTRHCTCFHAPSLFTWLKFQKRDQVILLQLLDFILVPVAQVLSLTTCPNGQPVQLTHLPNA